MPGSAAAQIASTYPAWKTTTLGKLEQVLITKNVNHKEQQHWVTQTKTPKPTTGPWNNGTNWAMRVSHELSWPLRQCLSRQWGHALTDVQRGPSRSAPLTLHLECFSSFCSPRSVQFSLCHAHLVHNGVLFLGQKPERKPGNISWLLFQD